MEEVSKRMLEQWSALELYFDSFLTENLPATHKIYIVLKYCDFKVFYSFMSYILPILNHLKLDLRTYNEKFIEKKSNTWQLF